MTVCLILSTYSGCTYILFVYLYLYTVDTLLVTQHTYIYHCNYFTVYIGVILLFICYLHMLVSHLFFARQRMIKTLILRIPPLLLLLYPPMIILLVCIGNKYIDRYIDRYVDIFIYVYLFQP